MSTTTTMPAYTPPSQPHTHSRTHSSHKRPSTTPRPLPSTSSVVGKAMSPRLTPMASKHQNGAQPRSPSPGYFGLSVADSGNVPDSNPGQHTRQNWDFPSSSQTISGAPTPRTVSSHMDSEYDGFRRQSQTGRFDLSHGHLTSFAKSTQSRHPSAQTPSVPSGIDTPMSPRTSLSHQRRDSHNKNGGQLETTEGPGPLLPTQSLFDIPRNESPAPMTPSHANTLDHQLPRLSLPSGKLDTPPLDRSRQAQRADTLPPAPSKENPTMITPQQFATLVMSQPHEVLLLDLRVFPHYAKSRVQGALNLCIPTTLLKRPSFNVQKLAETFTSGQDQTSFARWRECKYIVLYDANSAQLKDATTSVTVVKKFLTEGWTGQGLILRGGFLATSRAAPEVLDHAPVAESGSAGTKTLSMGSAIQAAAAVAGGCPMPTSKSAANPFFSNIRQNTDLIDGVGQMPIKQPAGFSQDAERHLPRWLREISEIKNEGKLASDRFLAIEKAEQKRMQEALSGSVSYGTPGVEAAKPMRIAGIEKGSKNRYNNIFPYDHSRVRLQGEPAEGCDYVNANYVKAKWSTKRYIATQAPIPATFDDFWRVVWEQDIRVIVMLTAESEGGQVKSHPYWNAGSYGPFKLKQLSERRVSLLSTEASTSKAFTKRPTLGPRRSTAPHPSSSRTVSSDASSPKSDEPSFIVRHLALSHSSYPFQPMREITQLQYSHWPDFGAPTDPYFLLGLIERTNKYVQSASNSTSNVHEAVQEGQRPVLVHCSAGCGRTGTFCTIDSVIDMLRQQMHGSSSCSSDDMDVDSDEDWRRRDDVDLVAKTVEDFRSQRLSMVQNLRQFVLCYETVLQWIVNEQSREARLGRKSGH